MKKKVVFLWGMIVLGFSAAAGLYGAGGRAQASIPKEVKSVMEAGLSSRRARQDIPFEILNPIYLPAGQKLHGVFLFKIRNADLGFAHSRGLMKAEGNVFLQFRARSSGTTGTVIKELYAPLTPAIATSSYIPDMIELYSLGFPLPPGDYVLSMAVTSTDLSRIGTAYLDFSFPDPNSFTSGLDISSVVFINSIERMPKQDSMLTVHSGAFTYSVTESGKEVIKFGRQKYTRSPLVSQPLPLKITVKVTSGGTSRTEKRDPDSGDYSLVISIRDNISGKKVEKSIPFKFLNLKI